MGGCRNISLLNFSLLLRGIDDRSSLIIDAFEMWWWLRILQEPTAKRTKYSFMLKQLNFSLLLRGIDDQSSIRKIIDAFSMWCWRRILQVPWTAKSTNSSILKQLRRHSTVQTRGYWGLSYLVILAITNLESKSLTSFVTPVVCVTTLCLICNFTCNITCI